MGATSRALKYSYNVSVFDKKFLKFSPNDYVDVCFFFPMWHVIYVLCYASVEPIDRY